MDKWAGGLASWRHRLARFRFNRDRHGLWAVLRTAWLWRFDRGRVTLHLFAMTRANVLPPLEVFGIETRFATKKELAEMVANGLQQPDTLGLLEAGDALLLQFVHGKRAGWSWFSTRAEVELLPGLFLTIPPDTGYAYRTWTEPELRGHGLQSRRALALFDECRRRNRVRLLCFVKSTNLASLKGVAKAGYRRVATLCWRAGEPRALLSIESSEGQGLSIRVADPPVQD